MSDKKSLRDEFRSKVYERDGYRCAMCGYKPEDYTDLDAHHITDRNLMPNGGYCAANGITLCTDRCQKAPWIGQSLDCHHKAETYHATGTAFPGYAPTDLYGRIKSSYKWAFKQSLLLTLPAAVVEGMARRIDFISTEELEVCLKLREGRQVETWELTCDELDEDDPLIKSYGRGRYYVPDD